MSFKSNLAKITKSKRGLIFLISTGTLLPLSYILLYLDALRNSQIPTGVILFMVWLFISVGLIRGFKRKPRAKSGYYGGTRRGWTEEEKEQVRYRQDGRCRKCGKPPPRWEYHHRDGNRSNNSLSNCEGLCPNCHSVETLD